MALTKVRGSLIDMADLDLSDVGALSVDSIAGDNDANTSITFSGSDVITIATGGSGRLTIGDGALSPVTTNQIDLGTGSLEFKDAYFDGTVEADAITIGGSNISTIYSAIAGSSSIVTTGALNSGSITSGFGTIDTGSSNISTTGTLTGGPLVGSSLTMGSAAISEADIEQIDDLTAGTVVASKAVVVDGSKNIATLGTVGCGAITSTGSSSFATSVKTPLIEYTDGDDAITIADGGGVTMANGITSTAASNTLGATSFNDANITNVGSIALDSITSDAGTGTAVTFSVGAAGSTETASKTGSVGPDMSQYTNFVWTLTGNLTLTDPGDEAIGQSGIFVFIQDGTGSRTLTHSANQFFTAGGTAITLSTAANSIDVVPYFVQADGKIHLGKVQAAFADA